MVVGHLNPGDSCRSVLAVRSVKSPGRITERKKVYQHKQSQSLVSRISSSHRVQRVQIHGVVASQTARYGKSERGQSAESQKGRKKYCLFCPPGRSCPPRLGQSERVMARPALPLAAMILIGGCSVAFSLSSPFGGATASSSSSVLPRSPFSASTHPPSLPPLPPSYHRSFLLNFISTNPFSLFDAALVSSI